MIFFTMMSPGLGNQIADDKEVEETEQDTADAFSRKRKDNPGSNHTNQHAAVHRQGL